MGLLGASAGGILAGRAIPAAGFVWRVVAKVGSLTPYEQRQVPTGPSNTTEFGSVKAKPVSRHCSR